MEPLKIVDETTPIGTRVLVFGCGRPLWSRTTSTVRLCDGGPLQLVDVEGVGEVFTPAVFVLPEAPHG